jgi:hypothetical protein
MDFASLVGLNKSRIFPPPQACSKRLLTTDELLLVQIMGLVTAMIVLPFELGKSYGIATHIKCCE